MLLIVGPTASGKTELSLRIARHTHGEIISADSRQLYRHMDIGTAKPVPDEQRSIPHHCIDIKNPDAYFSAGEYGKLARETVKAVQDRHHLPIVTGGSGLYIQALIDGMFEGDFKDQNVRNRLTKEAESRGVETLYNRLRQVDPLSSTQIHAHDLRRIVRALEVYELSGKPISKIQKDDTEPAKFESHFWGLNWPRAVLYQRINQRVDLMIEKGLVGEVQKLLGMGYHQHHNAMDSVGYKEIVEHLEGKYSLDEAIHFIRQNTRRFAKRQMTWFKRNQRIQWIDLEDPVDWDELAQKIIKAMASMKKPIL